jgi:hypothetical protein
VVDYFGEASRKRDLALYWTLPGSRSNPITGHLDSFLAGRKGSSLHLNQKRSFVVIFCGLDNILVFILCSDIIME